MRRFFHWNFGIVPHLLHTITWRTIVLALHFNFKVIDERRSLEDTWLRPKAGLYVRRKHKHNNKHKARVNRDDPGRRKHRHKRTFLVLRLCHGTLETVLLIWNKLISMQILIIIMQTSIFADDKKTGLMNIIIFVGLKNAMVKGIRLKYSFSHLTI